MSACALVRRETAALHSKVEAHLELTAAEVPRSAVWVLVDALADLAGAVTGLAERWVPGAPDEAGLLHRLGWPRRRRRLELLDADRRTLGPETSKPPAGRLPGNTAGLVGALYVLEGSTLGGVLIDRELRRQAWYRASPLPSLTGYGADTGRLWRSFRAAADEWAAAVPGRDRAMAEAASAAFRRVDLRMTGSTARLVDDLPEAVSAGLTGRGA